MPNNKILDENALHAIKDYVDNTWTANALNTAGYVSAPSSSTANKVWKTDGSGNPAWRDDANSGGTVTKVSSGVGLTGGDITTTGTLKAKLKEETANTADSSRSTSTSGGLYSIEVDKSGNLAVRVPWTDHTYTVNNGTFKVQGNGTDAVSFTANQSGNSTLNIKGGGYTTVTKSANGEITVSSTGDGNTWIANALNTAGYVAAPTSSNSNQFWGTDGSGNPSWKSLPTSLNITDLSVGGVTGSTGQYPAATGDGGVVWANPPTHKYQHNIKIHNNNSVNGINVSFSFIDTVSSAYTSFGPLNAALYGAGFNAYNKTCPSSGWQQTAYSVNSIIGVFANSNSSTYAYFYFIYNQIASVSGTTMTFKDAPSGITSYTSANFGLGTTTIQDTVVQIV